MAEGNSCPPTVMSQVLQATQEQTLVTMCRDNRYHSGTVTLGLEKVGAVGFTSLFVKAELSRNLAIPGFHWLSVPFGP